MNKQKIGIYLRLCKEAGINNEVAIRQLQKHAIDPYFVGPLAKPGLIKRIIPALIKNPKTTIGGLLLALGLSAVAGSQMGGDDNTKPSIQKEPDPKTTGDDGIAGMGTGTVLGGLGGAGLGAYFGPDVLPSMDPDTARLVGGVGGGLAGALGGSFFNKESNRSPTIGKLLCNI